MRFGTRVFLLIFLVSALTVLGVYLPASYWYSQHNLRSSLDKAESVARLLASESEDPVLRSDFVSLLKLYESAVSAHREIAYIFCEQAGTVVARTLPGGVPSGLLGLGPIPNPPGSDLWPVEDERGRRLYHLRLGIGTPSTATLHVGLSADWIEQKLAPFRRLMLLVALVLLAVLPAAFAYAAARKVTRPILALRKGAERLGGGDLEFRLHLETGDEIEQLAEAFNRMADHLARSYATLEERNAELESEVGERRRATREREAMLAQLLQAQKMEAVGILAGGVAHDFNNLLTVIQGNADMGLLKVGEGDAVRPCLERIDEASSRAAALVRQLLLFSRKHSAQVATVDLSRQVDDLLPMLRRLLGEDIQVSARLAPDLEPVLADPSTLDQVVMNLAVNARDAMPDGGTLALETQAVTIDDEQAARQAGARPGRYVRLSVSDTGVGMAPEVAERAFDPFFTTKAPGKGTGLGLSVVDGIVQQAGGWIRVTSRPGGGTTFDVHLPEAPAGGGSETATDGPRAASPRGSGERILVIEDEPDVRGIAVTALREHGFRVLEAGTASHARQVFSEEGADLRLVFSDVALPDGTGIELADEFRRLRPDLPVLLTSGYADNKSRGAAIRERRLPFLAKPYRRDGLLEAVERALAAGRGEPPARPELEPVAERAHERRPP